MAWGMVENEPACMNWFTSLRSGAFGWPLKKVAFTN
jgi:hypothetical protein